MADRPTWDEYFLNIVQVVASRSTCLRRQVGAVIVRDNRILTTGYNGAPCGVDHCAHRGCIREQQKVPSGQRSELCRGAHAEQNAIVQAALHGVSTGGATLYCNTKPCATCAKMIINAGIVRVVYGEGYPDELSGALLAEAGVKLDKYYKD